MNSEKLEKIKNGISRKFEEMGFFIKEDIEELIDTYPEIAKRLENTKLKKINFFYDEDENSVGFTLDDVQVEFFIKTGEDEKGPWYEAEAEIRYF